LAPGEIATTFLSRKASPSLNIDYPLRSQRYSGLKDLISQYIRKDDSILMVGAGNSRLSEDMFEDGYGSITNIDASRVVVDQMIERYKDRPALLWQCMNACALEFPDESFDVALDKGTLDSILCGEGSVANAAKLCTEISRVLKPNGVYVVVSYGIPDNRVSYLENDDYAWTVKVHTVPKPTINAAAVPDTNDANAVHYIYVCKVGSMRRNHYLTLHHYRGIFY
jgi:ubiquinone/menaquinone biosynthesis C-methylase UbiE